MNQKMKFKTDVRPEYLHAVDVDVENRGRITGHRIVTGQAVEVRKGINRPAGRYVFRYAEWNHTLGEHLLYVESLGRQRCVRQADLKRVIG